MLEHQPFYTSISDCFSLFVFFFTNILEKLFNIFVFNLHEYREESHLTSHIRELCCFIDMSKGIVENSQCTRVIPQCIRASVQTS